MNQFMRQELEGALKYYRDMLNALLSDIEFCKQQIAKTTDPETIAYYTKSMSIVEKDFIPPIRQKIRELEYELNLEALTN